MCLHLAPSIYIIRINSHQFAPCAVCVSVSNISSLQTPKRTLVERRGERASRQTGRKEAREPTNWTQQTQERQANNKTGFFFIQQTPDRHSADTELVTYYLLHTTITTSQPHTNPRRSDQSTSSDNTTRTMKNTHTKVRNRNEQNWLTLNSFSSYSQVICCIVFVKTK